MDIYKYIAENEIKRFTFFFTFKADKDYIINYLNNEFNSKVHIYDIFPEPHSESVELKDILSVITSDGSEMFIPAGIKVNIFSNYRILFGLTD